MTIAETNAFNMEPYPVRTPTIFEVAVVTLEVMRNRRKQYGGRRVIATCESHYDAVLIAETYRERLAQHARDGVPEVGMVNGEMVSNRIGSISHRWEDQVVQVVQRTVSESVSVVELEAKVDA